MAGRVLTDASPLFGLAWVNGLTWLGALFESVWVPDEVLQEVLPGRSHPDEAPALLLMDERAGRALAIERGLRVTGTAAVIGMARMKGLIPSARTVFARLHASDFCISAQVTATILRRVGQ